MGLHISLFTFTSTTTRDFLPPMIHNITLSFSPFQLRFAIRHSYCTSIPLPTMTSAMSHLPTTFQYQPHSWFEYLLIKANHNWNGGIIFSISSPTSVVNN